MFDLGARMTSRSLALFCVCECYKSDRAVHHFPWSCVTVSYSEPSLRKYKSTADWACTLNLSTPPLPCLHKMRTEEKKQALNTAFILFLGHMVVLCPVPSLCIITRIPMTRFSCKSKYFHYLGHSFYKNTGSVKPLCPWELMCAWV